MAANRLEPTKESGETREAAPASAPAPAPSGGFKAWLPLLVTLVTMPLLAYAVTTFVLLPRLQKGLNMPVGEPAAKPDAEKPGAEAGGGVKKAGSEKEIITLPLLSKAVVNVAGTMGAHYLLFTVALTGGDSDLKGKLTRREVQLKDAAMTVLCTKSLVDIEKPGARNQFKGELIRSFNSVLGGELVEDLYFTEFAIQ